MAGDLITLAERVEGLGGPCRETDVLIVQALYPDIGPCEPHCAGDTPIFWNDPLYKKPCPLLTASLDAVVALIGEKLPGWAWKVGACCVSDDGWVVPDFNCPKHGERLRKQFGDFAAGSPEDTGIDVDKRPSGNPAIALLAAFLRGYALHLSTSKGGTDARPDLDP